MKRFLILIVLLLVIGTVAYFALNRTDSADGTSPVIAGAPSNADPVARGEYLARAADCIACHTVPETGKPFAGGLPFKLPFSLSAPTGNYIIVARAPDYSWVLVSDPTGFSGYVLTRDQFIPPQQYQQLAGQLVSLGVWGPITPTRQYAS